MRGCVHHNIAPGHNAGRDVSGALDLRGGRWLDPLAVHQRSVALRAFLRTQVMVYLKGGIHVIIDNASIHSVKC